MKTFRVVAVSIACLWQRAVAAVEAEVQALLPTPPANIAPTINLLASGLSTSRQRKPFERSSPADHVFFFSRCDQIGSNGADIMKCTARLGTAMASLLIALSANGAQNEWTAVGPDGGSISTIAYLNAANGEVLASTSIALYRSSDFGETWARVLRYGHSGVLPTSIAVNPANPDQILAVSFLIYRSIDGGRSWNFPSGPPAQVTDPSCIVFSRDGAVAWLGTSSGRVYRSTDFGTSWEERSSGLPVGGVAIQEIDTDAASNAVVYARGADTLLYRTVNSGATWTALAGGSPHVGVTASPSIANTLIALRTPYPYRSLDRGDNWLQGTLPGIFLAEYAPSTPSRAIGFLHTARSIAARITADDGITWFGGGRIPFGDARSLAIHPGNHDRALVGSTLGLAATVDSGTTWTDGMRGIREPTFDRFVTATDGSDVIYAPAYDANVVYRRHPTTGHWQGVARQSTLVFGAPTAPHFALTALPSQSNTLYMGRGGQIGQSTDGGVTWNALDLVAADALSFDPSNPQVGFAASYTSGVRKTIDGGANWAPSNSGLPTSISQVAIDPINGEILYAGTGPLSPQGVFKSVNGGANWTPANTGIEHAMVNEIAMQPGNSSVLYAATDVGLYKSVNAGGSWSLIFTPAFRSALDLAIDREMPTTLYVTAAQDVGISRSVDGGATWEQLQRK